MQKEEEKEDILENLERKQKIKKFLIIAIISVLLIILIFISFSAYFYFKSPEKTLGVGANIESALLSQDGKTSYVKLLGGSLDKNITKIKFIFTDAEGKEYIYETSEGIKEIEVPYEKTIWDIILGFFGKKPDYLGVYNYDISAGDLGIDNFENINEVSVLFEYETEEGEIIETPVLDTTKPTTTTTSPGGPSDGTTTPTPTCIPKTCSDYVGTGLCEEIIEDNCQTKLNCGNICGSGYNCINNKCEFNCSVGINCFYVNVTSRTDVVPNGSRENPFNLSQAQNYANNHTNEEITFLLANGNYGEFSLTNIPNRTNWVTWKSNEQEVIFNKINIDNFVQQDAYIKFENIKVQALIPDPLPPNDGKDHSMGYLVEIREANKIELNSCKILGFNKYITGGLYYVSSDYSKMTNCELDTLRTGIYVRNSTNFTVDNNYMHDIGHGSVIRISEFCNNTLIENNHVYGHFGNVDDDWFPADYLDDGSDTVVGTFIVGENVKQTTTNATGIVKSFEIYSGHLRVYILPQNYSTTFTANLEITGLQSNASFTPTFVYEQYHLGSMISIRSAHTTIRNNTCHDGGEQGVMWYNDGDAGGYYDMIMENNLFYDLGVNDKFGPNLMGCGAPNSIYNMNPSLQHPVIIRNNTFIGCVNWDAKNNKYDILKRYEGWPFKMGNLYCPSCGPNNGEGFYFYNNLIVGPWEPNYLPDPTNNSINHYEEDNNLWWVQDRYSGTRKTKGANTFFAVWLQDSIFHGYVNYFENITPSSTFNTEEYNYTSDGITQFFVNPGFYTGPVGNWKDKGRNDLDYHPLMSSPICNGGYVGTTKVLQGATPGVAWAGALPCICTNDTQCVQVFGVGDTCDLATGECVKSPAVQKTNNISQYNITWTFDKEYEYGTFANGDYWVVGPVNITGITPASLGYLRLYRNDLIVTSSFSPGETVQQGSASGIVHSFGTNDDPQTDTDYVEINLEPDSVIGTFVVDQPVTGENGGILIPTMVGVRDMHGSMINPSPGDAYIPTTLHNGFDSAIGYYNANYNVALDVNESKHLVIPVNSSLVSVISKPTPARETLKGASVLTVLPQAPLENSFRPPYCGDDKTIKFNVDNLNYNILGNLMPVAGAPNLSEVENYFERVWLDFWPGSSGRSFHPANNMPGYGGDMLPRLSVGALMLNCDFTEAQKKTLMIRFVQLGIDNYGITQDGGTKVWNPDGHHGSGRKWPILFAGLVLNDSDMKNIGQKSGDYLYSNDYGAGLEYNPPDYINFGEDSQTFYVEESDVYSQPYTCNGYHGTYSTGTVTCTKGSTTVVGSGTLWTGLNPSYDGAFGAVNDAEAYNSEGKGYSIASISDDTHLELTEAYRGYDADPVGTVYSGLSYKISDFVYYGHAATASLIESDEYASAHLGLPEFSTRHALYPSQDVLNWQTAPYRENQDWFGFILSAHIMNAKTLWNHNALFDYEDRYIAKQLEIYGGWNWLICWDKWSFDMWNTYRADYGRVWECVNGTVRNCEKQLGVCQGASQICTTNETFSDWSVCDYGSYYDGDTETRCSDSYDNDCDGCINNIDSDCGGLETNCSDGIDDDCDKLIDCDDNDCSGYSACKPPEDYIAYWKFDEKIGNKTPDETGVNNGTLMNGANITIDGERGNVLSLDGVNDYVDIGDLGIPENGTATISAWFYFKGLPGSGSVIDLYGDFLFIYSTNHYIYISGTNDYFAGYISTDYWYHIVFVYSGDSLTSNLWVNGNKYAVTNQVGSNAIPAFPGLIGKSTSGFNGSIDEVMIYNRALNESEIIGIYCNQGGKDLNPDFCASYGFSSLSPFTRLWNFLKGLLTQKTGKAILTGKTITGNAVNETGEDFKVPYIILFILAGIILIIAIIIVKIKKNKKKSGKRIGKKLKKAR